MVKAFITRMKKIKIELKSFDLFIMLEMTSLHFRKSCFIWRVSYLFYRFLLIIVTQLKFKKMLISVDVFKKKKKKKNCFEKQNWLKMKDILVSKEIIKGKFFYGVFYWCHKMIMNYFDEWQDIQTVFLIKFKKKLYMFYIRCSLCEMVLICCFKQVLLGNLSKCSISMLIKCKFNG